VLLSRALPWCSYLAIFFEERAAMANPASQGYVALSKAALQVYKARVNHAW
jgi:hypothetical protein